MPCTQRERGLRFFKILWLYDLSFVCLLKLAFIRRKEITSDSVVSLGKMWTFSLVIKTRKSCVTFCNGKCVLCYIIFEFVNISSCSLTCHSSSRKEEKLKKCLDPVIINQDLAVKLRLRLRGKKEAFPSQVLLWRWVGMCWHRSPGSFAARLRQALLWNELIPSYAARMVHF